MGTLNKNGAVSSKEAPLYNLSSCPPKKRLRLQFGTQVENFRCMKNCFEAALTDSHRNLNNFKLREMLPAKKRIQAPYFGYVQKEMKYENDEGQLNSSESIASKTLGCKEELAKQSEDWWKAEAKDDSLVKHLQKTSKALPSQKGRHYMENGSTTPRLKGRKNNTSSLQDSAEGRTEGAILEICTISTEPEATDIYFCDMQRRKVESVSLGPSSKARAHWNITEQLGVQSCQAINFACIPKRKRAAHMKHQSLKTLARMAKAMPLGPSHDIATFPELVENLQGADGADFHKELENSEHNADVQEGKLQCKKAVTVNCGLDHAQPAPSTAIVQDTDKEESHSISDNTREDKQVILSDANAMCVFCKTSGDTELTGPMVEYNVASSARRMITGPTFVHELCAEWAPNIFFVGDNIQNLADEVSRSRRLKCDVCGMKGAALGCCVKRCTKTFHYPCARNIGRCKWDEDNFLMLCPQHSARRFPKSLTC